MKHFPLNNPAIIFHNTEYGTRLLFKNRLTNPRAELGKNGITFHNWFSAFFHRTISVDLYVIEENGDVTVRIFYLNRNSLIKYLGGNINNKTNDAEIIAALELKTKEPHHLNHAGKYNQDKIKLEFYERIKASFLSWLYQKTIGSLKRLIFRLFWVHSEHDLLADGELLARARFQEAYAKVPAYQNFIKTHGGVNKNSRFVDVPATSKSEYIKTAAIDSDTHVNGKYPEISKTDTSTGTTGKPTSWVRGERELAAVKKSLHIASQLQFGNKKLNFINAFALGPWATGLTSYELMRETGSVFATGPDKEKILDYLLNLQKYEQHQRLQGNQQAIIAGYPPFLMDFANYVKEQGYDLSQFALMAIVGGQAMSEAMRDQLIKHGFQKVYSSYGASDLDINIGVESDFEITVRKTIEQNPELARELYGENKGLPMVFHYDPLNYHIETDDKDELIFTCTRNDRSSPRIRYDLGDQGSCVCF